MKALILTLASLMISAQAIAIEGQPAKSAASINRESINVQNQSAKVRELTSLSKNRFKDRIGEVETLLSEYTFSKRSIREREVQIREYLKLAAMAIELNDDLVSDEYLYQAYTEYRSDFENVMKDISLGRFKEETLTVKDMARIRNSLNDQKSGPAGQDDVYKK